MARATATSKGQITVPREVREDLGLSPGSVLTFYRQEDGTYLLSSRPRSILDLRGWFGYGAQLDSSTRMRSWARSA